MAKGLRIVLVNESCVVIDVDGVHIALHRFSGDAIGETVPAHDILQLEVYEPGARAVTLMRAMDTEVFVSQIKALGPAESNMAIGSYRHLSDHDLMVMMNLGKNPRVEDETAGA